MKSGPSSLVLFPNQFGAFLRSFALVGPSRAFRAAAPLSHEHGQEEPGQEADAARCCRRGHACAEERTGKAAGGRPPGIETAARTATATPSTASMFGRRNGGLPAGKTPSASV